nr:uncharacterized protein LOC129448518 isoform X2 [Misgurnus anguillicaudatus]
MAAKSHISLLGLIIFCSSLTGTTADTHVFSSSGKNVSLPCINALSDCTSTTWIYSKQRSSVTVELINGGIKKKDIERAERLSLGSDCSLNIYKTTEDDRGLYTCQQYVNYQKHGTDTPVFLHVLHASSSSLQTEIKPGRCLTLSCQLFSYEDSCSSLVCTEDLQLSWVNKAGVNLQTDSRYQISGSGPCIITMSTKLQIEDNNTEWRCLVKTTNEIKTSANYTVKFRGPSDPSPAVTTTKYKPTSTIIASETEDSKIHVSSYKDTHVFSGSGENVSLSCINALSDCTSTTWNYNNHRSSAAVELIAGGIKKNNIERAERLSLGSDCSLNIYNTTEDDRGLYTCRQYVNGQIHGNDARVYLHVLHASSSSSPQTEIKPGRCLTLSCQLFSNEDSCSSLVCNKDLQLFWVNQAGVNLQTDSRYKISQTGHCISTLRTTLQNNDNNTDWRCLLKKIKETKTSANYTVKFRGPSDTNPAVTTTNYETTSTINASETEDSKIHVSLCRVIILIVEITAFAAPTVILLQIVCTERAENKRKTQITP